MLQPVPNVPDVQPLRSVQNVQSRNSAAKKRFGLCVLDYIVTSNHIHLLVKDTGANAESMQLIAGRTAQEYNLRKCKQGAFWEDRYHATAIEIDEHLHRCMVYIDLNMVRAGVVNHPAKWRERIFRNRKAAEALRDNRLTELNGVEWVFGSARFSNCTPAVGRASAGEQLGNPR